MNLRLSLILSQKANFRPPQFDINILRDRWGSPGDLKEKILNLAKGGTSIEFSKRVDLELDRIEKKGTGWYFLIMADLCQQLRDRGIRIGPGRGSVCGSLIAYLLEITTVDPLKFGLSFDRFLSEDREDLPDIDLDVQRSRRGEAIEILEDLLGGQAARISAYSRFGLKSTLRDISWSKFGDSNRSKELLEDVPSLELASKIQGHIRHRTVHAAGVIALPGEGLVPLARSKKGSSSAVEFELATTNRIGLLKFDVLGLTTLDLIDRLERGNENEKVQ